MAKRYTKTEYQTCLIVDNEALAIYELGKGSMFKTREAAEKALMKYLKRMDPYDPDQKREHVILELKVVKAIAPISWNLRERR